MIWLMVIYLAGRTQSATVLRVKLLKLWVIQNMMVIKEDQQRGYTNFLIKKSSGSGGAVLESKSAINSVPTYQPTNELHK